MNKIFLLLSLLCLARPFTAQVNDSTEVEQIPVADILDSLYIEEVEGDKRSPKVLHAEPLYIDLIRDLGARKGEKEWNVGLGITDNARYADYDALVEYEWAPVDRLGLEIELPFSLYYDNNRDANTDTIPRSNLNSVKLAAQYSFYVNERSNTSMALGYIHEFEVGDVRTFNNNLYNGNVYNPFLIIAKRWGQNFHNLIYAGPHIVQGFGHNSSIHTTWQFNTNIHYMIDGTRNFIGVEFNKQFSAHDFDMTIRPQMRLGIADNLLVGIVTGIPVARESQRFSTFIRLIYEPRHKPHK